MDYGIKKKNVDEQSSSHLSSQNILNNDSNNNNKNQQSIKKNGGSTPSYTPLLQYTFGKIKTEKDDDLSSLHKKVKKKK